MNINTRQKLNKILNNEKGGQVKIGNFSKNQEKIANFSKNSSKNNNNSDVLVNKTTGRTSEKKNFSNFLNMKTVFKDSELSERQKTFNTFLKKLDRTIISYKFCIQQKVFILVFI